MATSYYRVTARALFLRSRPVIEPQSRVTLLPCGQRVVKLAEAADPDWWRITTFFDGREIEGFVAHRYLEPETPVGIEGIDVSHHQGVIDWSRVAATEKKFAFIRATYGTSTDRRVTANWREARREGVIRGAYHFYRNTGDPAEQAEAFLAATGDDHCTGDLPPVIDIENNSTYDPPLTSPDDVIRYLAGAHTWLEKVAAATGKSPMIYTLDSFWTKLGNPTGFEHCLLWVVDLSPAHINLPVGWDRHTFLQYSFTGKVDGIDTNVDLDSFNGDSDALHRLTEP